MTTETKAQMTTRIKVLRDLLATTKEQLRKVLDDNGKLKYTQRRQGEALFRLNRRVERRNTQIRELKDQITEQGEAVLKMDAEIDGYKEGLRHFRVEVDYHRLATTTCQEQFNGRGQTIRVLEKQITVLRQSLKAEQSRGGSVPVETELRLTIDAKNITIDTLNEQVDTLKQELREHKGALKHREQELRAYKGYAPEPPRYTNGGNNVHAYYIHDRGERIAEFHNRALRDLIVNQLNDNEG